MAISVGLQKRLPGRPASALWRIIAPFFDAMSIGRLFAICVASMAIIVALVAGQSVLRSASVYRSAIDAIEASLALDLAMRVVENMSLERGPTIILLAGDTSSNANSSAKLRQLLLAARDAASKGISELQRNLPKLRRVELTQANERDELHLKAVNDLAVLHVAINRKVDDQLSRPLTSRRNGVSQEYVDDTIQLRNSALQLLNSLQARIDLASPEAAAVVQIARYAADLRDVGGFFPTVVTAAINERRPFTKQELSSALKVLGRVEELRSQINAALAYVGNPAELMTSWDKAETGYFAEGQDLIGKVLTAGETDGHYPLVLAEFLPEMRKALQSLMLIRDAGLAVALRRTIATRDAAWRELEISVLTLVGVVMAFAGLWAFFRWRVVIPMIDLAGNVNRLVNDGGQIKISMIERQDEIGGLARAMQAYRVAIGERDGFKQRATDQERRSRQEIDRQKAIALEAMAGAVESKTHDAVQVISETAQQVKAAARNAASRTDEVSLHSRAVASASAQAASASTTVSAATEELTTSIGDITRNVTRASTLVNATMVQTEKAQAVMQSLAAATTTVSQVSDLIRTVAEQTNLLALNATIEAARAGQAGRGFAVVAHEVKALANQTGRATDDISRKINEIQTASDSAVSIMAVIKGSVAEVDNIARSVAAGMEEQEANTESIAKNVALTMRATQEIAAKIADLNVEVDEARTNAGAVSGAISNVTDQLELLRQQLSEVVRTTLNDFRKVNNI
jgi:methyl-accepting chemotaxis protein